MKQYRDLTVLQKSALLKFPAYVTLLAAGEGQIDRDERLIAIKLAHIKSFSCHSILTDFCKDSAMVFEFNLSQLEDFLPKEKKSRDDAIRKELVKLETILRKLGSTYSNVLHESMKTFQDHVSRAHHSVIEDFLFPITIHGLTD